MVRNRQDRKESGQALMLSIVCMSLFLLAGIGLAIDGSQLYNVKQAAQSAADATAMATVMSLFNATNAGFGVAPVGGGNPSPTVCTSGSILTPCYYAKQNGFDPANGDRITVEYWAQANAFTQEPGVSLSSAVKDPVPLLRVTMVRPVPATLMRLVGGGTMDVAAQATAAIVTSVAPIPILILHPTLDGALTANGTGTVKKVIICGGPKRSIQVNSCAGTGSSIGIPGGGSAPCGAGKTASFGYNGNLVIDLSKAGPFDTGGCVTGTGGDFGNFGLPVANPGDPPINLGTAGSYLDPASPVADPLINVPAPTTAGLVNQDGKACPELIGKSSCPDALGNGVLCPVTDPAGKTLVSLGFTGCTVLNPGIYTSAGPLNKMTGAGNPNGYYIFTPGVYYVQSGKNCGGKGGAASGVCFDSLSAGQTENFPPLTNPPPPYPTCANGDKDTGCGVLFFLAANGLNQNVFTVKSDAKDIFLLGSDPTLKYQKIVIFADRTMAVQNPNSLGGGGTWNVTGTIYLTHTVPSILVSIGSGGKGAGVYQSLSFNGNPASGTVNGEIIVDALDLSGTPNITMNLDPATLPVRYVALVR